MVALGMASTTWITAAGLSASLDARDVEVAITVSYGLLMLKCAADAEVCWLLLVVEGSQESRERQMQEFMKKKNWRVTCRVSKMCLTRWGFIPCIVSKLPLPL